MLNIAIITARGQNTSIADKNLISVGGKPFVENVIDAALCAKMIDKVFLCTDDHKIGSLGHEKGVVVIGQERKDNHGEVILSAFKQVSDILGEVPDTVTILLGNTIAANADIIDLSIDILKKNSNIDSAMTVWQAQDDHPYRAMTRNENGFLKSFLDVNAGTSRQSYPVVYYYDQGPWTFRPKNLDIRRGPGPWWWMGDNSFPIIRNWVTGRDVHTHLDVAFSEYWLSYGHKDEILNKEEVERLTSK